MLFNNGGAQFTAPTSETSNIGEFQVTTADDKTAVADLNGDGKADLVSAGNSSLIVSLGKGDGTFKPDVNYSLGGTGCNAVVLRDVNGDGKLDALTANYGSSSVSIFLGNENGTFQAAGEVALPSARPVVLAIGDFNQDGKPDIGVSGLNSADTSTNSILLGNGTGAFTPGTSFAAGTRIESIAAVSLGSNALIDLVASDTDSRTVRLFYGNGNGTFGPAVVYPVGKRPSALVTGDFNGDGPQDIAVALDGSSAMPVFFNQGGTYITLTASSTNPAKGELVTITGSVTASQPGKREGVPIRLPRSGLVDGDGDGCRMRVEGAVAGIDKGDDVFAFRGHVRSGRSQPWSIKPQPDQFSRDFAGRGLCQLTCPIGDPRPNGRSIQSVSDRA